MALKKKLTKADYDKLSESLKTEYVEDGDNYRLDLVGEEDNGALTRAKAREVQLRKEAEAKARELEDKLLSIEGAEAKNKGDVATLEKNWKKQTDDLKLAYETRIAKLTQHITSTLVDAKALEIAGEISTKPKYILPYIKERLVADFEGDTPRTGVLGPDGKISPTTIDELKKSFIDNADFADIIIGSKASGSAGPSKASSASPVKTADAPNYASMPAHELAALLVARKETGQ